MNVNFDVLINGGGPVGMGLALELGLRGVRTCVVERHHAPQPIPKGQNLTQRSCEHFRAWGCEEELRRAHPVPKGGGIGGMTSYGTLLSRYHYDWLNRAHVGQYYFAANARLPQYATERVLRACTAEVPEVSVLYGWSGGGLRRDGAGVTLDVSHAESGAQRTLRGRYLVGCDGSRSFVREAAGISETRADHNRLMALVVFRSEALHALLERYPGKAFYCVLRPDLEGYWLFFGRVDHGHSWFFHAPVPAGTTAEAYDFRRLLHHAVGQAFELEIDHVGLWDLRVSLADRYRSGNVFIAGDAAHSHPPYGGYGINTGFEDARNLGWKLAAVVKGWGGDALLDSYEAERRAVFASTALDFIERYIEDDREFLKAHSPESDREDFERAWYGRNLDAGEVDAFEPNYAGSPIIVGGSGDRPSARGTHSFVARPGHLLPPPGPGTVRAAEAVIGPDFTLLSGDVNLQRRFDEAAMAMDVPLQCAHLPAAWRDVYEADSVLIRPDRFVVWVGDATANPWDILQGAVGRRPASRSVT